MTYCIGLAINKGLVFMSDTRTNAGVDDISTVRKLRSWSVPGDRVITIMTAGNLATTQSVVSLLDERSMIPENRDPSIFKLPTMFQVAQLVGNTLKEVISTNADTGQKADNTFNGTIILGGQIKGMAPRLFLIYPEGNFIEAGEDSPFFQIGEVKYGKPILIRTYNPEMSFEDAVKLLLLSFDSTIKANLSVGLPLDIQIYEKDSLQMGTSRRIAEDDAYYQTISKGWSEALRSAFQSMPDYEFGE